MADDIDIEEHDILDNPRIQHILNIKDEPIDLDSDHYEEPGPAYDEYNEYEHYREENFKDQEENYDQIPQYIQEPPENENEETPFKLEETPENEVAGLMFDDHDLGFNVPNDFNMDADFKESVLVPNTETEYIPDLSNEIYHYKNKIILGTKPCKRPVRDVNAAYVDLEDWGVRLENSDCYCKECQTLFATRNALDAHNMIAHSFLIALNSPESSESESQTVPENTETAKYCDHCKKYFPSDHALIQHLYDLITANKPSPTNTVQTTSTVKYEDCTNTGKHMVYSCLICNYSYLDIKWFRTHYRTVHSQSEIGSYEKIPFTGVCKICNRTYKTLKRFNMHIKASHLEKNPPELLTGSLTSPMNAGNVGTQAETVESETENVEPRDENEESKSEDEISQAGSTEPVSSLVAGPKVITKRTSNSNFQCIKCKTFYSTICSIKSHQRRYHRGEVIIKKLVKGKGAVSKKVQKIFKKSNLVPEKLKFSDSIVPKNSIFKCNTCKIHFVTCWSAILHTCVEFISRYQCDICCKEFRLQDMEIHNQQHNYNDAFNTYYISKDMSTKIMFWCQKCAVYFELRKIQNHLSNCKGASSSVRCKLCEVDVNDILTHMHHHKVHSSKSEFIFIDDLLPGSINEEISPKKDLKRKLPMDSEPGPSKVRRLDDNQFAYCNHCRTYMKSLGRVCHTTGECKKIKSKSNCEFCGLVFFSGFPTNCHEEYHRKTNANLKDFTFVDVNDQTPVVPDIPEFPKCDVCETHDFTSHKCGSSKTCKICNKKFSESAYKLHLLHHKYLKEDTEVNELIKKYETLASTWNILYLCKTCNVATDSYDDVVVHCQNHYNNIHDCPARKCDFCSLKLEETCFKRHRELHSPSITRESFKTVVYDYKNLLSEDWLKLFGNLSKAEVQQIVTRSIYVTRFVKMKLLLDGPPKLTIYKCETCKLYVDPFSILNHTTQCLVAQHHNKKSFTCEICFIPFCTAMVRKEHEKLHNTPNITANSFRIVAFNDKSDRNFNRNLQVDAEALEFELKTEINAHPIDINPNIPKTATKAVLIYQCRQCKCCSHNAESLIRHKCLLDKELVKCIICKIDISSSHVKDHRKWHKQNPKITKHHIKHVIIDNKVLSKSKHASEASDEIKRTFKLHQCKKCKVCYPYWVKHEICSKKVRKCRKCGYLFTPKSYIPHNLWHLQNVNATRSDIRVVTLSSEQSAKSKAERLRFVRSLKLNRAADAVKLPPKSSGYKSLKNRTADAVKLPPKSSGYKKRKKEQNEPLYQCYSCKICSYSVSFVKKHSICSSKKKGIYHCKICDLKFKFYGMRYHKNWHAESKNNTKKLLRIYPFKGEKILKIKDKTVINSNKKDGSSDIQSKADGYHCKKCGASSKKTIFFTKHKCQISPGKPNTNSYLYYQCKDCDVCWTSKRHDCVPDNRVCRRCKLKFSYDDFHDHMQKHAANKDMTRSKITVVPFRKNQEETDQVATLASKPVQKVSTVFRCSCGLHFISQNTIEKHFNVCSPDHEIPSENCSKCGLLFPTDHLVSHLCNHHSYGKGNIEVKTIHAVTYYRCGSCKCLFTSETRVLKHNKICDPDQCRSIRCDECDLDFHESDIKTHRETHTTLSDLNRPCRIVTVNKNTRKLDVKIQKDTNESEDEANASNVNISKSHAHGIYTQNGTEYDNMLYKCDDCKTHFLKFNSFLRHLERKKCVVENKPVCPHCGLCFTKVSLTKHIHIHHKNLKLKLRDFVINIGDSNTDSKHSKAELVQYKPDHNSDDMKIDLYKCHICEAHFLHEVSLRNHMFCQIHNIPKINCLQCGLPFTPKALQMHLDLHHKQMKLGLQNFRIVEKCDFQRRSIEVVEKVNSPDHTVENELVNLTSDEVDVPETSAIENETKDIIYYHCVKCKIHFTSIRSLDIHFEESHKRVNIETCDLCDLSFAILAKHKMHHETTSTFLIQDVNDESECVNKLFKCNECQVHFVKPLALLHHISKREQIHAGRQLNRNCPECGLLFNVRTMKLHQMRHHGDNNLCLEDLVIDTSFGKYRTHKYGNDNVMITQSSSDDLTTNSNDSMDKTADDSEVNDPEVKSKSPDISTKLYKCGECNVYFLTQATCYKHIVKHLPMDPKEYIECKMCSFQFRIVSLNTHIRKHHKTDFAFDKVLIEEYQPKRDEEKVPTIDIYYAKDKVQSRLISTTTEDNVDDLAEISQSEIESTNDPEASNDSKDTLILTTTNNLNTGKELDSKKVMLEIPPFTNIKEESDSIEIPDGGPDIPGSVRKSNESASNVNEISLDGESSVHDYSCRFCSETFISRRAKDFHENLEHLDILVDCPICQKSFNTSLLNVFHLEIKNDLFTCCVCNQSANVSMLPHHSFIHKHIL